MFQLYNSLNEKIHDQQQLDYAFENFCILVDDKQLFLQNALRIANSEKHSIASFLYNTSDVNFSGYVTYKDLIKFKEYFEIYD